MANVDEVIAKLKMEKKRASKSKENKSKEVEIKEKETKKEEKKEILKQVIEGIKQGEVNLEDNKFLFKKESFLDRKIEIPMPQGYFKEKVNQQNNITLANDELGISLNFVYLKEGAIKQSFNEFKAGMEKGFKELELYLEWIEDGEIGEEDNKIKYATYRTPTGKGDTYNVIVYKENNGSLVIGNYNCFYKNISIWEYIIKGSIMLMKINE